MRCWSGLKKPCRLDGSAGTTLPRGPSIIGGPALEPAVGGVVPLHAVVRFGHPVGFIGKAQELAGNALSLQGGKCGPPIGQRNAVVMVGMNAQRGLFAVCHVADAVALLLGVGYFNTGIVVSSL